MFTCTSIQLNKSNKSILWEYVASITIRKFKDISFKL